LSEQKSIFRRTLRLLPGYPVLRRLYGSIREIFEGTNDGERHWTRIVPNREIRKFIDGLSPGDLKTLEISGATWGRKVSFKSYRSVHFPDFDICQSSLDETFDLIIAEHVFEHLLWPYRAGRNIYKMLNPGGWFLVETPFLVRVHNVPVDCSRWTETGLKHFLAECGFNVGQIQTGSWGNRACVKANFSKWAVYQPWLHSLKNEPNFPITIWALARK